MKFATIAVSVMLIALTGSAYAQVSFDFEDVTVSQLTEAGWVFVDDVTRTVSGVPLQFPDTITVEAGAGRDGSAGLHMGLWDMAYFPLNGQFGTLEMWVYDPGMYLRDAATGTAYIATAYGPRFGLRKFMDVDTSVHYPVNEPEDHGILSIPYGIGAGLVEKSAINSNNGYGIEWGLTEHQDIITIASPDWVYTVPVAHAGWAGNQSWYSCYWLGVPGGRSPVGVWNKWTIAYTAPGQVEITLTTWDGRTLAAVAPAGAPARAFDGATPGGVSDIYLYGGNAGMATMEPYQWFEDVVYDDITWTPLGGPVCNPGDADGDGDVDLDDFVILKNNFGTATGATCAEGDFDGDGDVDLDDFVLLKNNFGVTY
ncbi:MAG: hypothetical protein GX591_13340 [Planctomycetes bacterium]|nr:hypothetical protein [Planctomycetota bacterium]